MIPSGFGELFATPFAPRSAGAAVFVVAFFRSPFVIHRTPNIVPRVDHVHKKMSNIVALFDPNEQLCYSIGEVP